MTTLPSTGLRLPLRRRAWREPDLDFGKSGNPVYIEKLDDGGKRRHFLPNFLLIGEQKCGTGENRFI